MIYWMGQKPIKMTVGKNEIWKDAVEDGVESLSFALSPFPVNCSGPVGSLD